MRKHATQIGLHLNTWSQGRPWVDDRRVISGAVLDRPRVLLLSAGNINDISMSVALIRSVGLRRGPLLSASCAFANAFECVPVAYGGEAARAIEWGKHAMRLGPFDTMSCIPQGIVSFGNFLLGRHEDAVAAGRRAVELNPGFSILHGWLAAPLASLGRIDEARASAARLLGLDTQFSISCCRHCARHYGGNHRSNAAGGSAGTAIS